MVLSKSAKIFEQEEYNQERANYDEPDNQVLRKIDLKYQYQERQLRNRLEIDLEVVERQQGAEWSIAEFEKTVVMKSLERTLAVGSKIDDAAPIDLQKL